MAAFGIGNVDSFRKALLHISHQLSKENIRSLKCKLSDPIYEDKLCGHEIFQEMIRSGKLSESNRSHLILFLKTISRHDLAMALEKWNGKL